MHLSSFAGRKSVQGSVAAVALATLLALAGCQPIQPLVEAAADTSTSVADLPRATTADVPLVIVQVTEESIALPDTVPAGAVAFRLDGFVPTNENETMEVGRLRNGATLDEVTEMLSFPEEQMDLAGVLGKVQIVGLTGSPDAETIVDLEPGEWFISRTAAPGGPILQPFTVAAVGDAAALQGDVQMELLDFAYSAPESIPAGPQLWEIANNGGQWHMMLVAKLAEGVTPDEAVQAMMQEMGGSGPSETPVYELAAAWEPMSEGMRAWIELDLAPGNYVLVCPIPDVNGDFMPHMMKGMVGSLVVTE
jgi:hypothetical protein